MHSQDRVESANDAAKALAVEVVNLADILRHSPLGYALFAPKAGDAFSKDRHEKIPMDTGKIGAIVSTAVPGLQTYTDVVAKAIVWCTDYSSKSSKPGTTTSALPAAAAAGPAKPPPAEIKSAGQPIPATADATVTVSEAVLREQLSSLKKLLVGASGDYHNRKTRFIAESSLAVTLRGMEQGAQHERKAADLEPQVKRAEETLDRIQAQVNDIEAKLAALPTEAKIEVSAAALEASLTPLLSALDHAAIEYDRLRRLLADAKATALALKDFGLDYSEKEEEVKKLEPEVDRAKREMDDAQAKVNEIKAKLAARRKG